MGLKTAKSALVNKIPFHTMILNLFSFFYGTFHRYPVIKEIIGLIYKIVHTIIHVFNDLDQIRVRQIIRDAFHTCSPVKNYRFPLKCVCKKRLRLHVPTFSVCK